MTTPLFDMLAEEHPPGPREWRRRLVYEFDVYGTPAPQGSKKAFINARTGRAQVKEQLAERINSWRADVRQTGLDHRIEDLGLLDAPLVVDLIFTFMRPKNHYGTGRNATVLKPSAPPRPAGMPDLSKLARSTEDALTAVLWKDDARITEYGRLLKVYAYEDRDALSSPGARIRIYRLEPR